MGSAPNGFEKLTLISQSPRFQSTPRLTSTSTIHKNIHFTNQFIFIFKFEILCFTTINFDFNFP